MTIAQRAAPPARRRGFLGAIVVLTAVGMASSYLFSMGGVVALATQAIGIAALSVGIGGMAFYAVRGMRQRRRCRSLIEQA